MTSVLIILYNAGLVAGCGYVVFGLGHSGWWFAAAAAFMMRSCECEDDDE